MTKRWMPDAAKFDEHVRRVVRSLGDGAPLGDVYRSSFVSFWCEPVEAEVLASLRRIEAAGGVTESGGMWRWRAKRGGPR